MAQQLKSVFWIIYLIILVGMDLLAAAIWLGAAPCIGGGLDKCSSLKPGILIIAGILTAIYFYHHLKAYPRPITWKGNPKIDWVFAIFLFLSLVFIGETLPQLAGYWRGIPPGEYGFHFGMLDNLFEIVSSGKIYDLIFFATFGIVGAFLYRYLYWPLATLIAISMGATIEFNLFNRSAGYFDTYNPDLNLLGTIIFLLSSWTVHFLLSYTIYSSITKYFARKGQFIAIIFMLALNLAGSAYFAYQRSINPDAYEESIAKPMLSPNTCPDQILLNNGPLVAYQNGQEVSIDGDQNAVEWIRTNCPNTEEIFQKP